METHLPEESYYPYYYCYIIYMVYGVISVDRFAECICICTREDV